MCIRAVGFRHGWSRRGWWRINKLYPSLVLAGSGRIKPGTYGGFHAPVYHDGHVDLYMGRRLSFKHDFDGLEVLIGREISTMSPDVSPNNLGEGASKGYTGRQNHLIILRRGPYHQKSLCFTTFAGHGL